MPVDAQTQNNRLIHMYMPINGAKTAKRDIDAAAGSEMERCKDNLQREMWLQELRRNCFPVLVLQNKWPRIRLDVDSMADVDTDVRSKNLLPLVECFQRQGNRMRAALN